MSAPLFEGKRIATVADVLARYANDVLADAPTGQARQRSLKIALEGFLDRDINLVAQADLLGRHAGIANGAPIHANRSLAYVRAFLAWAYEHGLAERNVLAHVGNPIYEHPRFRILSYDELGEIFSAARALGYPFGPAYRLMILTLATREEVARLTRAQLSDEVWTLPKLAGDLEPAFQVPLIDAVRAELDSALDFASADLVFTMTGTTPISGWSRAKRRLDSVIWAHRRARYGDETSPMEPWRLYDIRRSFEGWVRVGGGVPKVVVERCLGRVASVVDPGYRQWFFSADALATQALFLEDWARLIQIEAARWDDSARCPG